MSKKKRNVKKNNKEAKNQSKKTQDKKTKSKKTQVKKTENKKIEKKPKKVEKNKDNDIIFKDNVSANKCIHCKKYFEKILTICPFCNKKQNDYTGKIVIISLFVILLILVAVNIAIDKYYVNKISESEYKFISQLLSYEELVRLPKKHKNTKVKVIGEVVKVDGTDTLNGNVMNVTLNTNLFEDSEDERIVEFEYIDQEYDTGIINGDIITVYGEYAKINGNIPFIQAKYITFGS